LALSKLARTYSANPYTQKCDYNMVPEKLV
jgi:hypothetical protein